MGTVSQTTDFRYGKRYFRKRSTINKETETRTHWQKMRIGNKKFFAFSDITTKRMNIHLSSGEVKENQERVFIGNAIQAYIHSKNSLNYNKKLKTIFNDDNKLSAFLNQSALQSQKQFAKMIKAQEARVQDSVGNVIKLDEILTRMPNVGERMIEELDKEIGRTLQRLNLQGSMQAHSLYQNIRSFTSDINIRTFIEKFNNGEIQQALNSLDTFLGDLDAMYKLIQGIDTPPKEASFRSILLTSKGEKRVIKGKGSLVQSAEAFYKAAPEQLKEAASYVLNLIKAITPNSRGAFQKEDIDKIVAGGIHRTKLGVISKGLAQYIPVLAKEQLDNIQDETDIAFSQHMGNKMVTNVNYSRTRNSRKNRKKITNGQNTRTTDAQYKLKNLSLSYNVSSKDGKSTLKIDLTTGISVKFYQGLSSNKGSAGGQSTLMTINIGSKGTLREFINNIFPNPMDNNRYDLYNYIAHQGANQNQFKNFIIIRHFTRLFTTGGSGRGEKEGDFASYLIINGVPISMWRILQQVIKTRNQEEFVQLLLKPKANDYINDWINPQKKSLLSAYRRSHLATQDINRTRLQVLLHLKKLRNSSIINSLSEKQRQALVYA